MAGAIKPRPLPPRPIHFVDGGAFTDHAGELIATNGGSGNIWTISGDTDGDGNADFQLLVVSADNHVITGGDFVL